MAPNIGDVIENLKGATARRAKAEEKYKKELTAIKEEKKSVRAKLETARNHAILSSTPYLVSVLGLAEYQNITLEQVLAKPLNADIVNAKDFNLIFKDYLNVMQAVGDYFKERPELVEEIHSFVLQKSGIPDNPGNE